MQGTALETRGEVTATAYDATGTRMVTCTAAGAVHVWDRDDDTDTVRDDAPGPWRQSSSWAAHENGACTSIAFAPSEFGQCICTCGTDGSVRVWREAPLVPLGASGKAASHAAAAAATAADEGTYEWVLVGDLRDARGAVEHCDFAPAAFGLALVTGGADGVVRFYRPRNELQCLDWELTNEFEALDPGARVSCLRWRVPTAADELRNGADDDDDKTGPRDKIPQAIAVGFAWSDKSDARVLTFDEGNNRWVGACVFYQDCLPVTDLAWAPNADASPAGAAETIACAVAAEVLVFRVFGLGETGGWMGRNAQEMTVSPGSSEPAYDAKLKSTRSATLSHPRHVTDLDWNMVGTTLATSAADGIVRVWAVNMQTGVWEARAQLVGE